MDKAPTRRLAHVDGLRAVAVLSVLIYHATIQAPGVNPTSLATFFAGQGCHGVELFFVISGFCLSYPTLAKLQAGSSFDVAQYASHRLIRIMPPFYIAFAFCLLLSVGANWNTAALGMPNTVRQLLFLDGGTHFVNPSFWTLPLELRWYFAFPVALWLWIRSPKIFAMVLLSVLMLGATRAQSADLFTLPAFLFGIVAAQMYVKPSRIMRFAGIAAFGAFVITLAMLYPSYEPGGGIMVIWEIPAALFVLAAGESLVLRRFLSMPILSFVGAASYSIYLVHEPVVGVLEAHGVSVWAAGLAGLAVGILFYLVAERPFTRPDVRNALTAYIQPHIERFFQYVQLSPKIPLTTSAPPMQESPHVIYVP